MWPVGGGQLTNIGKKQHYLTGQWLRQRYVGFLPDVYSAEDIYVRSTDVSRTIESALANLAGLYPPSGAQIWNPQLLWQPIPVHTVPSSLDYIIAVNTPNCPRFDKLYEAVGNTASIQQIVQQHQSIMDYFEQNSGYPKTNSSIRVVFEMADVRDTLMVEAIYNMTPLAWTKEIYPNVEVDELSMIPSILPSYTTELAQIRAGYFLQEVLDRAASKVNGTLIPDRKLWVYSAHDITISTVLYGMGMWDVSTSTSLSLLRVLYLKEISQPIRISERICAIRRRASIRALPEAEWHCVFRHFLSAPLQRSQSGTPADSRLWIRVRVEQSIQDLRGYFADCGLRDVMQSNANIVK